MADQDRLEELLDRWEESRKRGQELSASELCPDCPALADELAAQIGLLKRSEWMLAVNDEEDLDCLPLPPGESLSAAALVPASLTLEQFTTNIAASGVMTADEVSGFDAADAQELAARLLRSKKLTEHQARLIAKGNTKGLVLGNYVILDKIDAGGMGQVFKARHRRMKRIVALKVLPQDAVDSPTAVERFHREVEAAAKLEHPNIVTAHDADQFEGTHFLVMQYVEGHDLASLVRHRGPMPVDKALECVIQAAKGLEYAHGVGVVHRDIKPANLLLDKRGTVKILDMGLARLEKPTDPDGTAAQAQLTQNGTAMGTVDFMSPEQAMDTHAADARSDIYSLGCTLFYLLTGKRLYEGPTLLARMLAHKEADIPLLHEARDGVPSQLSGVFQKMVAKQAGDRYQTATALLADLEKLAGQLQDAESALGTSPSGQRRIDLQSKETSCAALDQTLNHQPKAKHVAGEAEPADGKGDGTLLCEAPEGPFRQKGPVPFSCAGWYKLIGGGVAVVALAIFAWLWLAGVLFTVETPGGIIRIESNVPDIEVFVDDEKVVCLTDPNDQKKIRVEVKPGAKTLTVSKDGFEAEVSRFNLKTVKGPIKVSFERVEPKEEVPTTADGDVRRQVAEWVIGAGGKVVLENRDGTIAEIDDLPEGPLWLEQVLLDGDVWLDRDGLALVGRLDRLGALSLQSNPYFDDQMLNLVRALPVGSFTAGNVSLTDAGIRLLNLRDLRYLHVYDTQITDETLKYLARNAPKISCLVLARTKVTDEGVSHFEERPVAGLNVGHCPGITDEAIEWIAGWPPSETGYDLGLSDTAITDSGLGSLAGMSSLVRLAVSDTGITDAGLARLAEANGLRYLDITNTEVTAEGVRALRRALPDCDIQWVEDYEADRQVAEWVLSVGGSVITECGQRIENPDDLPSRAFRLGSVYLEGDIALDPSALGPLAQLADTRQLGLHFPSNPNFTDNCLECLSGRAQLGSLALRGTKITDAGLARLVNLPRLHTLSLNSTAITDVGLKHLEKLKALTVLHLQFTKVSEQGVASLLEELPVVRSIELSRMGPEADGDGLARLQRVRPECVLRLYPRTPSQIPAYWVLRLGGSVEITAGDRAPVRIVDADTMPTSRPFQISAVDFNDNPLLNDACARVFPGIEGLKRVSLRNTGLTNAAVKDLRLLKDLEELDLTGTEITAQAIEAIRSALPNCRVVWESGAEGMNGPRGHGEHGGGTRDVHH